MIPLARQAGARMIEVNVDDTELSPLFTERLRGAAGELLPRLFLA